MSAAVVTWADKMIAAATVLQAVAVFGALVYAHRQVEDAREAREQSAADARTALEATTRPYVVVDFDVESIRTFVHVVISNNGQSAALNVRFEFDPPITTSFAQTENRDPMQSLGPLRDGVPTLAPGRPISLLFDFVQDRVKQGTHADQYMVTVSYDGPLGRYVDTYVLDLGMYVDTEHIGRNGLHEIGVALDALAKEIKGWTASPGGGVHVRSDHDLREAAADRKLAIEEHRARVERRRQQPHASQGEVNDEASE